jgi:CRISPR-associated endonuclease Csy4
MNYYVDIRILPNSELSDGILMNELYSHLHKVLVSHGGDIGICFPNFNKKLGDILRLHGTQISLQKIMSTQWTANIMDYVKISEILVIPENVCYRVIKRVQTKSSKERLLRRSVRKGWLTEEEAPLKLEEKCDKKLTLPFLQLNSSSTKQRFRLFIEHGPILTDPIIGSFNAYGFSFDATIPWF